MTFYPKGLLVALLFAAALSLALDVRLGVATCVIAVVAYVVIEASSMGIFGRRRHE
jgi:hypothetical protein